jgi:hypothetical protein
MIPWLDSCEDVSRYLRGSIVHGPPAVVKTELLFELLLPLVICGILAAALTVCVMHLRQGRLAIGNKPIRGPIQRWRLRQRIRAFASDVRERAKDDVARNEISWRCRRALSVVRQIIGRSAMTQP